MMTKKSVGIIGAGAAGLCAGKKCLDVGHSICIFEQNSKLGGTWIYEEQLGIHSSMYEKMHTNLPKEIMNFPNFPFPKSDRSFIEHSDVLDYLNSYAEPLKQFISFNSKVVRILRNENTKKWNIFVEKNDKIDIFEFDAIFVCNGHFFKPRIPEFVQNLTLPILHSHDYRKASDFSGQNVVVIGAGPSGCDISLQIAEYANTVFICHREYSTTQLSFPPKIKIVPGVANASEKTLILDDGTILNDLDSVILCTGYRYFFPFIDSNLIQTPDDDSYVSPLFYHVVHVNFVNSLFFIGLNINVIPFILFDLQVSLAIALMNDQTSIEDKKIKNWEKSRLEWLKSENLDSGRFHILGDEQWDYFKQLAEYANVPFKIPPVIREIFDAVHFARKTSISDYKSTNFEIVSSNVFRQFDSGFRDFF